MLFCCYTETSKNNDKSSSLNNGENVSKTRHSSFTSKASAISLLGFPAPSSRFSKIFHKSSKVVVVSSTFLPSSRSADDTSELSGLYQLLSSREIVMSGRKSSHFPSPSIAASHRNEVNSRHQDLATMLAELSGSSNRQVYPSVSSQNLRMSSATWMSKMQSGFHGEQGKGCA